jgi:hypothetical protein
VTRLFCRRDLFAMCEVPLPNGRRADLMGIDPKGKLTIVEIKVSKADLTGDGKWTDYLDYCDNFFWAVPPILAGLLDEERFLPATAGVIVADRYDAAVVRDPPSGCLPPRGARLGPCDLQDEPRDGSARRSIRPWGGATEALSPRAS